MGHSLNRNCRPRQRPRWAGYRSWQGSHRKWTHPARPIQQNSSKLIIPRAASQVGRCLRQRQRLRCGPLRDRSLPLRRSGQGGVAWHRLNQNNARAEQHAANTTDPMESLAERTFDPRMGCPHSTPHSTECGQGLFQPLGRHGHCSAQFLSKQGHFVFFEEPSKPLDAAGCF